MSGYLLGYCMVITPAKKSVAYALPASNITKPQSTYCDATYLTTLYFALHWKQTPMFIKCGGWESWHSNEVTILACIPLYSTQSTAVNLKLVGNGYTMVNQPNNGCIISQCTTSKSMLQSSLLWSSNQSGHKSLNYGKHAIQSNHCNGKATSQYVVQDPWHLFSKRLPPTANQDCTFTYTKEELILKPKPYIQTWITNSKTYICNELKIHQQHTRHLAIFQLW